MLERYKAERFDDEQTGLEMYKWLNEQGDYEVGFSISGLARAIGCSQGSINYWVESNDKVPSNRLGLSDSKAFHLTTKAGNAKILTTQATWLIVIKFNKPEYPQAQMMITAFGASGLEIYTRTKLNYLVQPMSQFEKGDARTI